ncbi:MAG: hypothetical protein RR552_01750 [Oscillospiraceae bacterium]
MEIFKKMLENIKSQKRLFIIVILGVIAITLIVLSEIFPKENAKTINEEKISTKVSESTYDEKIQKTLKEIIENIDGAGKTKVMVTLQSSSENYYAKNNKSENKKNGETSENKSEESFVIDKSSELKGIIIKTDEPKVRGVVVVCEGGENPKVKSNVTIAVSAALGLGTNNICVLKMKSTEE